MGVTKTTVWLPDDLWRAVRFQARSEGGVNVLILRAVEDYLASLHRKRGRHLAGKYKKLVARLSRPVADLHLSARLAACLRRLGVRSVYEVVRMAPTMTCPSTPMFHSPAVKVSSSPLAQSKIGSAPIRTSIRPLSLAMAPL